MQHIKLLDSHGVGSEIDKIAVSPKLILGTTTGLAKTTNEDRLGYRKDGEVLRLVITDGHWGDGAAEVATSDWLQYPKFPDNRDEAVKMIGETEEKLYQAFGKPDMDPASDFTPETSLICLEISRHMLRLASYGDCRLLVARNKTISFEMKTEETWLGVFSKTGLRDRISVEQAVVYQTLELRHGDFLFLFSDGLDQCVYETPTISNEFIALQAAESAEKAFDVLMAEAFSKGAEDNISLAVIEI